MKQSSAKSSLSSAGMKPWVAMASSADFVWAEIILKGSVRVHKSGMDSWQSSVS